jgi:hypothetical protein
MDSFAANPTSWKRLALCDPLLAGVTTIAVCQIERRNLTFVVCDAHGDGSIGLGSFYADDDDRLAFSKHCAGKMNPANARNLRLLRLKTHCACAAPAHQVCRFEQHDGFAAEMAKAVLSGIASGTPEAAVEMLTEISREVRSRRQPSSFRLTH